MSRTVFYFRGMDLFVYLRVHKDVFGLEVLGQAYCASLTSQTAFFDSAEWRRSSTYDPSINAHNTAFKTTKKNCSRVRLAIRIQFRFVDYLNVASNYQVCILTFEKIEMPGTSHLCKSTRTNQHRNHSPVSVLLLQSRIG